MPEDAFATGSKSTKFRPVAGRESSEVNTILNGRGVPKATLGANGDFYIDILTFTIYGPKRNGKWPVGASLKGPQGIEGKAGEKGVSGSQSSGARGEKGEKGERGDRGEKGETGERGADGAQGAVGATGATGPAGATGATGATGSTGATGATGSAGSTGPAGANGSAGTAGATGATGPAGPRGETGTTGVAGPSSVSIGSITFPSTLSGPIGQQLSSDTFATLGAGNSYVVDLTVFGTNTQATANIPLKFEIFAVGESPTISNVQWSNHSGQTYRNGSVEVEYVVAARFVVKGSTTLTPYSLRLRLTGGVNTSSSVQVTFQGNFRIQLVASAD